MASDFEKLAPELLLAIAEAMDQANSSESSQETTTEQKSSYSDLLSLSSTSRTFRSTLAPFIFKHVNLSNKETSIECCRQVVNSPRAEYVRELRFSAVTAIPSPYGEVEFDEAEIRDVNGCLPPSAIDILSNLALFPRLEKVSVRFPWDESLWWSMATEDDWPDEEEEEEMVQAEADFAWRALPAKVFSAIAQNRAGLVKHFEYKKAFPKPVSTWYTDEFKAFLSSLESFSISLCGGDNGAGWQINTVVPYQGFVGQLQSAFFTHLDNITSLEIVASDSGPIGCEGYHHALNPIDESDAPRLRRLYLEQIFIDVPLRAFLRSHRDVLEIIDMRNCYACQEEESISWNELFTSLAAKTPKQLKSFRLLPSKIEIQPDYCGASEEDQQRVRDVLSKDPSKRLFPCGYLDDKYGSVFDDGDAMFQSFESGEDQKAWDQLQGVINHNRQINPH